MGVQLLENAKNINEETPRHPVKDPEPRDIMYVSCETIDINSDADDDGMFDEIRAAPACEDQQEAYLGSRHIRDSMEVQEHLGKVNEDELHEENPHLEDYLIPHHRHIESLDISSETETRHDTATNEKTLNKMETSVRSDLLTKAEAAATEHEELSQSLAKVLVPTCSCEVVNCDDGGVTSTDEEASTKKETRVQSDHLAEVEAAAAPEPEEHEGPSQCPAKDLVPTSGCEVVNSSDEIQPASLPGMDEPYKPSKLKCKIRFGTVLVRDYDMILGDHPCCSYGPPVTIGWDYLEYNPIDMYEYEFHRPPRRSLREMGLNYYQRKDLLSNAGFTEADFKMSKKEVGRAKLNRNITRSVVSHYPLRKAEDVVESARRMFKRLIKEDHWEQQKSLYVK